MDVRFNSASGALTVGNPTEPTTTSRTESVGTPDLLPGASELMFSGDPGAMFAALTMQTAHQEEKVSRAQRDACARAQENAEAAEIKDLREKADLTRLQGIVGGALQLGQAAMSFTSSMNSLSADNLADASSQATQDATAEHDAAKSDSSMDACAQRSHDDAIAFKSESRNAQQTASSYKAAGDLAGATKTLNDALFSGAITDKDTDSKAHDISAQSFKKMGDDAHDAENDAKALLTKAMEFFKEYQETKNQTAMAAIHRA